MSNSGFVTTQETEPAPTAAPSRPRRAPIVLLGLLGLYGAALLAISAANALGPERWWWSSLNLYLPQWIWAMPGAALVLGCLATRKTWRYSIVPVLLVAWVVGPLMGLRVHLAGEEAPTGATRVRVMTWNLKWPRHRSPASMRLIAAEHPDILLLQDSDGAADAVSRTLPGYTVEVYEQYVLATRFPVLTTGRYYGPSEEGHGKWLDGRLLINGTTVDVRCIHLTTPRPGLGALKHDFGEGGLTAFEGGNAIRLQQARVIANRIARDSNPRIVAGDFNEPVQSLACRSIMDVGFRDAFDVAGMGYGYTYGDTLPVRQAFMRIDHVMASRDWRILACHTGPVDGSDHRPVVADLALIK